MHMIVNYLIKILSIISYHSNHSIHNLRLTNGKGIRSLLDNIYKIILDNMILLIKINSWMNIYNVINR